MMSASYKIATVWLCVAVQANSFQYNSFSGPVSGEVQQVTVPRAVAHRRHHANHYTQAAGGEGDYSFDYVARPDYSFAYGVEDPDTGNSQRHEESRDGDVVSGEYSFLEADGRLRTVHYTADPHNGFQATVRHSAPGSYRR